MDINFIIGWIIRIFHFLLCTFALIAPYLTNNRVYLSFFIFYYVSVLTGWSINGSCFITDLEKNLIGKENLEKSYINNLFCKTFKKEYRQPLLLIFPLINTTVCLYKINAIN